MPDWTPSDVIGILTTGERVPRAGDIYKVTHVHTCYAYDRERQLQTHRRTTKRCLVQVTQVRATSRYTPSARPVFATSLQRNCPFHDTIGNIVDGSFHAHSRLALQFVRNKTRHRRAK